MAKAGSVNVDITADASKAKKETGKVKQDLQSFVKGLNNLAGVVGITLSVKFAIDKLSQFTKFALDVSSQFEIQRAALTAIIQGQERFLDVAGRQIPVEQARTQALKKTQEIIEQINRDGMRPVLATSREFQHSVAALLPTFRQFGVELEDSVGLMKQMADAAALASIPGDEMINQARQILSSNISNETKLAKVVGLNNEIVNQAKMQGRLAEVLADRFGTIANQADLLKDTFKGAQTELRNTIELKIDEHFGEARDAIKELLKTLNEVAKSDAFARLIQDAAKLTKIVAEAAATMSKMFEKGTLNVQKAQASAAAGKDVSALESMFRVDPVKFRESMKLVEDEYKAANERLLAIRNKLPQDFVTGNVNTKVSSALLWGAEQLGTDPQAGEKRAMLAEAEQLSARITALREVRERTKPLVEADNSRKAVDDWRNTPVEDLKLKIATEQVQGHTAEVEKLTKKLGELETAQQGVAKVQSFDPAVINFQLVTLTRIESSLQRQEHTQSVLRSLELQRNGVSKETADIIAEQEAAAASMGTRQKAVADATATIAREAENLASKHDLVVKGVLSLSDAYSKARSDELASINQQMQAARDLADVTEEERTAKLATLQAQKDGIDSSEKMLDLQTSLAKGALEQFKSLEGAAKLESEFGRYLAEQSPQAMQLLTLIDSMGAKEQERLASIQAQTVELQKQVELKRIGVAEQALQQESQAASGRLGLKQRVESAGVSSIGNARATLATKQEQEQLSLKITELEKQRALELQKVAIAEAKVQELQTAIAGLSEDTTEEVRERLALKLQEAEIDKQGAQLGVTKLEEEQALTEDTRAALPEIQQKEENRAFGDAVAGDISGAISGAIQSAMDGDFDFKKFGKQLSASLVKTAIQPFLDNLASSLSGMFSEIAGAFGQQLSSAVLGVIGLLGVMAFSQSETTSNPKNATLGKAFEERSESLRGVVAGRQSIPVAQIHNALSSALIGTNAILRQIASNTSGMSKSSSSGSSGSSVSTSTTALNATATV